MRSWRADALHWFRLDSEGPPKLRLPAGIATPPPAGNGLAGGCAMAATVIVCDGEAGSGDGVATTVGAGATETNGEGVGAAETEGAGNGATIPSADGASACACAAGVGMATLPPPALPAADELAGAPGAPGIAGRVNDVLPNDVVNCDAAKIGKSATVAALETSPRTSIDVSRLAKYAMPPGARLLFCEIELTTSLSVKPADESLCGSTCTSIAGVSAPPTLTFEMPSTCSSSGTMSLVTIAESAPGASELELTPSVTTVASAGSNVPTVGTGKSVGSFACAKSRRCCTATKSVVLFEVSEKTAEIVACPCCTVVLRWSRLGAPAMASSIGLTIASRICVVEPPG